MLNSNDYPALAALAAVLQTGSFDAAAHRLAVTPSAVSQRIKALEERMGTPLVLRGTPCRGTETGTRLARHMQEIGLLERQLAKDLGQDLGDEVGEAVPVPLAVNADTLATWFTPAMADLPGLLFQLQIDDQDHSADWLKRGEVMAAVSARDTAVPGCDIHPLGALRYLPVASPGFLARHFPEGVTAETLSRAPSLVYDEKDRLQDNWVRQLTGQRIALPSHRIPSTQGFVDAALSGLGWGLNPLSLLAPHLAAGRLVALAEAPVDIALYWHVSRLSAPMLAPLTEAVRRVAKAQLVQG
ncbi:LysR family transcriptional regulator ArgP [Celeribacter neptunius]|uniref:LysR family transcriptional regulator, chromosome initiation inhibitor n=1 Tax=Celeribacter neptunius TaxID=588602 RepID=A0A1I3WIM4_9RHOB|nr:LysR family transcriptional regulator ArgP [Celeribacter neptunius]SFK07544.1 LysR family transcriptional regulator, chromosome initiation inhibitor [Celeribacter neptunius]